jgi:hypothetical protein
MGIPKEITRDQVEAAMDRIGRDVSRWLRNRVSVCYSVMHPNPLKLWLLPIKLVISIAVGIATGTELPPAEFDTHDAKVRLKRLGFKVFDRKKSQRTNWQQLAQETPVRATAGAGQTFSYSLHRTGGRQTWGM